MIDLQSVLKLIDATIARDNAEDRIYSRHRTEAIRTPTCEVLRRLRLAVERAQQ